MRPSAGTASSAAGAAPPRRVAARNGAATAPGQAGVSPPQQQRPSGVGGGAGFGYGSGAGTSANAAGLTATRAVHPNAQSYRHVVPRAAGAQTVASSAYARIGLATGESASASARVAAARSRAAAAEARSMAMHASRIEEGRGASRIASASASASRRHDRYSDDDDGAFDAGSVSDEWHVDDDAYSYEDDAYANGYDSAGDGACNTGVCGTLMQTIGADAGNVDVARTEAPATASGSGSFGAARTHRRQQRFDACILNVLIALLLAMAIAITLAIYAVYELHAEPLVVYSSVSLHNGSARLGDSMALSDLDVVAFRCCCVNASLSPPACADAPCTFSNRTFFLAAPEQWGDEVVCIALLARRNTPGALAIGSAEMLNDGTASNVARAAGVGGVAPRWLASVSTALAAETHPPRANAHAHAHAHANANANANFQRKQTLASAPAAPVTPT